MDDAHLDNVWQLVGHPCGCGLQVVPHDQILGQHAQHDEVWACEVQRKLGGRGPEAGCQGCIIGAQKHERQGDGGRGRCHVQVEQPPLQQGLHPHSGFRHGHDDVQHLLSRMWPKSQRLLS